MKMRWLHLTDLHMGRHHHIQEVAMNSMGAAIERVCTEPLDLILITGDLANTGALNEYHRLERVLLGPVREMAMASKANLVCVPGNHDVDCSVSIPSAWKDLDDSRQSLFFENTPQGIATRSSRALGMTNYSSQLAAASGYNPQQQAYSLNQVRCSGDPVQIVALNTALFSDKSASDRDKTPAPTAALQYAIREPTFDKSLRTLVVGHHPISWFVHATQSAFRTCLDENRLVYIHGHEHAVTATLGTDGVASVGFGASYAARPDAASASFYSNQFSICQAIDDQLHLAFWEWDLQNGRWVAKTTLPTELGRPSSVFTHGAVLQLPSTLKATATPRTLAAKTLPLLNVPKCLSTIPVVDLTKAHWERLLRSLRLLEPGSPLSGEVGSPSAGSMGDVLLSSSERMFRCISARSHVISVHEVESANTKFDTSDAKSFVFVCLGSFDDEARRMQARFARKKAFSAVDNAEITDALSLALSEAQRSAAPQESLREEAHVVVSFGDSGEMDLVLLVQAKRQDWFYLIDKNGVPVPGADPLVASVRRAEPRLLGAHYGSQHACSGTTSVEMQQFDRTRYLEICHKEFADVTYVPLAMVGLRLPTAQLEQLYVPANALVKDETLAADEVRRYVEDLLESVETDEYTKEAMRADTLARLTPPTAREARAASAYYQEFGSVLVTGDPGSGKTCFVKREILRYCSTRHEDSYAGWYSNHTPVYVPLAEAAEELARTGSLIDVAASLSERRGLALSSAHLESLTSAGRVAYFFDGLDEISARDKRLEIISAIGKLVTDARQLGNRFVVTSRPAAVESADVPPAFRTLQLKGLSRDDMRLLATRIVDSNISPETGKLKVAPAGEGRQIVDKLLEDCDRNPSLGRLATNPLLLTLLVLVYANSGAPGARRHRVYAQAVQTLVSVRNRATGVPVLSEADLRTSLGALALAVMRRELPVVPSRREVIALFRSVLSVDSGRVEASEAEATNLLQRIAESTGLLVLHRSTASTDEALVSFMHNSFLEYYAAVAIAADPDSVLGELAGEQRWRETVTLVCGLLGDRGDMTDSVQDIVRPRSPSDDIALARLILGFECALECDVPPLRCQRFLIDCTLAALRTGAARYDDQLRQVLADRLSALFETTGNTEVWRRVAEGIQASSARTAAVFVDFVAQMAGVERMETLVGMAIRDALQRTDSVVREALCRALGKFPWLRDEEVLGLVRTGLGSSVDPGLTYAAAVAAAESPGIARMLVDELTRVAMGEHGRAAAVASRALVSQGLVSRDRMGTAVQRPHDAVGGGPVRISPDRDRIDSWLSSPRTSERVLALKVLPWVDRAPGYVYSRLFGGIKQIVDPTELLACLSSVRASPAAASMAVESDYDALLALLDHQRSDVRSAAGLALGALQLSERVVSALLMRARDAKARELRGLIRTLVQYAGDHPDVRDFVREQLRVAMDRAAAGTFGDKNDQAAFVRLLSSAAEMKVELTPEMSSQLFGLVDGFRTPRDIRRKGIVAYARLATPSAHMVRHLCTWLDSPPLPMPGGEIDLACQFAMARIRTSLAAIRRVYHELPALEAALVRRWGQLAAAETRTGAARTRAAVRSALVTVVDLKSGYREYEHAREESARQT
jgi:predicted MPP superfamily phosphohydrolase